MYIEAPLAHIPLRFRFDKEPGWRSWQPDSIVISWVYRKIGILEFTRPADLHVDQLRAAQVRKETKYSSIKLALSRYEAEGWQVQILPWVVGIRGMVLVEEIQAMISFLHIPSIACQTLVDCSVTASVEALAFMHRVRYARPSGDQPTDVRKT